MKSKNFLLGILALTLVFAMSAVGCVEDPTDGNGNTTAVTLNSVAANGSSTQTTTQLTITFSQAITGLSASNIKLSGVSGVSKGTLSSTGTTYTLPISGFTAGGTLNIAVSKSGYTISGSPKTVTIYYYSGSSGGSDEDDLIGGDGSMGSTLTITNAQVYSINWSNGATIQFDDTVQGLTCKGVVTRDAMSDEPKPLNNLIDGNPTVTLINGKLNITLGTPKASSMDDLNTSTMPSGITVSTTGVKMFSISSICDSSGNTSVLQYQPYIEYSFERYPRVLVTYIYSNKDVNISGKSTDPMSTYTYAMNLKAGWNSVIQTITEGTSFSVITKTGKPPADCKWMVRMYE
jgi:hypothetical protein